MDIETGNKGDAAIWNAQQIMLATLGITPMETCRYAGDISSDAM